MLQQLNARLVTNIKNKSNWLSLLSGLSLVFAYAPYSLWWLPFFVLPFWLNSIKALTLGSATKQGFIFAMGWFISGISWVHVPIDQFGGVPLAISLLLMLLLCLYLAIFPALACYLSAKFTTDKCVNLWLFPSAWLLCEYLRGTLLTGFPWLSLGYSQLDGPLAAFAPVIGESGITLVLLIISICIVNIVNKVNIRSHLAVLTMITVLTIIFSNTHWSKPTERTVVVALIQGNIAQSLKWQPDQEWPTMLRYLDLTRVNYDADIIIWPESAIPSVEAVAQDYLTLANQSAALNDSAIITGIINYNFESKEYFNSLIVLGKKQSGDENGDYYYNNPNRYYKNHLLPIGEFVPFGDLLRPLAPLFNLPQSSFTRGDYIQANLKAKDLNLLPLICFEIAFAQQLSANFSDQTHLLLTVSNDAWFGDSHGPHQHLDIARMRALEFARPLLRSTNNGITAVVDHHGKIIARIPQFEEGVLKTQVQLVDGLTPFSRWGDIFNWLLPLLLLLPYGLFRLLSNKKTSTH
ncbi:apolipoprotein N-acyltransferase [Colwelliaceae bacterium 6471]